MLHYYGTPPYLAPRGEYAQYYAKSQFGHGLLPAYGGVARQRGHGFGSLITGLLRSAAPLARAFLPRIAKSAAKTLLPTAAGVLADVMSGRNVKKSVKRRATTAGKQMLKNASTAAQGYINNYTSGPPAKRRATVKRRGRGKQQKGTGRKRAKSTGRRQSRNTLLF